MTNLEKFNAMEGNRSKELALQHARLMEKIEQLPPGSIVSPEIIKEKTGYEQDLRRRLYSLLIGDVLPVIPTATIGIPKAAKIAEKKIMITFHFDVISILGTRIDRFKIEETTKEKAWKKAREKGLTYPSKVSLKIS